jgi:D-3-phosphoglycerate dehydrogenase
MNVFILGDRFITNEIFKSALETRFTGSGMEFNYVEHQLNWPVEPMSIGPEVSEYSGTDTEIIPYLKDVEVVLTHTGCFTKRALDAAPNLKVIALGRGGPVNINTVECNRRGIPVIYAPGRNSGAVAEFTVGLILAQSRTIAKAHYYLWSKHEWRGDFYANEYVGSELSKSTLGLVGFGAIGSKVAKIMAQGFGSRVLAYDPYISDAVKAQYPYVTFTTLEAVLSEGDYISLHTKAPSETKGLRGAHQLAMMKPSAVLINTARPQLVDYDALYAALESGRLRGAGLDVFEAEPPKAASKVYALENVTATPHLGGASRQAAEIGAAIACDQLYMYLVDKKTPKFLYKPL